MSWVYLFIASIFEAGRPLGSKMADITVYKLLWIVFAVAAMALSGIFLYMAQKEIPIGTAYAVWTGIGAAGTFLIGAAFFHDGLSLMRFLGTVLIIAGVAVLKTCH